MAESCDCDCNCEDITVLEQLISTLHSELKNNKSGERADYIPGLRKQRDEDFGISLCTVDNQRINIGDHKKYFSVQSCSKPISYCEARTKHGLEKVHAHVGYEPTGVSFNSLVLNSEGLPHNPMVNAGAIMMASLIYPDDDEDDRLEKMIQLYSDLSGGGDVRCDTTTYLSEAKTADKNFALAYLMRDSGSFGPKRPSKSKLEEILNTYFQICSLQVTTAMGSVIAATLANGGVCPATNKRIFDTETVKDCLSLMFSCGMYDYSGRFAFEVGLPAKSGVSGCILLVVPGQFGLCVWSPPLDEIGNSVRGIEVCRRIAHGGCQNYHMFKNAGTYTKQSTDVLFYRFMDAVHSNDTSFIDKYITNMDVNHCDYDGRTPLHVACSDGNVDIAKRLLKYSADPNLEDRWGNTPKSDLERYIETTEGVSDTILKMFEHSDIPDINE